MPPKMIHPSVFPALRGLLAEVAAELRIQTDTDRDFYLNVQEYKHKGKPMFFGAVARKKNYVSFHLMPVYVNPALLDEISPELFQRMQGKACFNFIETDSALFSQLRELVLRSLEDYRARGWV